MYQLRRGFYALAPPYQKVKPHPFLVANRLQRGSYVTGPSVLAFWGLIPEVVPVTVSATPGRPEHLGTPLGIFEFRHIKLAQLQGYRLIEVSDGQHAFVATPEKALLDLIYLTPGADSADYLQELRLQNLDRLDPEALQSQAAAFKSPKLKRAVKVIQNIAQSEKQDYETL